MSGIKVIATTVTHLVSWLTLHDIVCLDSAATNREMRLLYHDCSMLMGSSIDSSPFPFLSNVHLSEFTNFNILATYWTVRRGMGCSHLTLSSNLHAGYLLAHLLPDYEKILPISVTMSKQFAFNSDLHCNCLVESLCIESSFKSTDMLEFLLCCVRLHSLKLFWPHCAALMECVHSNQLAFCYVKSLYLSGTFIVTKLFPNLTSLTICHCSSDPDAEITKSWLKLSYLSLENTMVGDRTICAIVEQCSGTLEFLNLTRTLITDLSLQHIGNHCKNLSHLIVPVCRNISAAGLSVVSVGCSGLTVLDTSVDQLKNLTLSFVNLTEFHWRGNLVSVCDLERVIQHTGQLQTLELVCGYLLSPVCVALITAHCGSTLKHITLWNKLNTNDQDISLLFHNANVLETCSCNSFAHVTDAGLQTLSTHSHHLRSLAMIGICNVTLEGFSHLLSCGQLSRLRVDGMMTCDQHLKSSVIDLFRRCRPYVLVT